ncbi:hypothetical protein BAE44_0015085, partial [Dichanthelium oligosanthes]
LKMEVSSMSMKASYWKNHKTHAHPRYLQSQEFTILTAHTRATTTSCSLTITILEGWL